MNPPHLRPWEVDELTFPQLVILSNEGKIPNPRRRVFASAAEASRAVLGQ